MNSMTGFGRAVATLPHFNVRVEISGVNRKQAEMAVNVPRSCSEWDGKIRQILQGAISRGRVNVSVNLEENIQDGSDALSLNQPKLAAFMASLAQASQLSGAALLPTASDLLRLDIISDASHQDVDPEEAWSTIEDAVKEALSAFLMMRSTEGQHLHRDLLERIAVLADLKEKIAEHAPEVPVRLREAMVKRLNEAGLPVSLDDERIVREIALFADKCDISEETTRLDSHFAQFKALCAADSPSGRPLDFLCQEIFREFNTIGSKANDATLAHLVVTAKTELEKIREQVQNIE